jgi:TetR/AcrR family transcriptional regulator, repressor for neighboring sulfatase
LMMAVSAFGDAVIGPYVRDMLDQEDDAMRSLIARILPLFLLPSGIPPAMS